MKKTIAPLAYEPPPEKKIEECLSQDSQEKRDFQNMKGYAKGRLGDYSGFGQECENNVVPHLNEKDKDEDGDDY